MPANRRVTTLWSMPSCDCAVEYELMTDAFDLPVDSTKKVIRVVRTCSRHTTSPFQLNSHPEDPAVNRPCKEQRLQNETFLELLIRLSGDANYTETDQNGVIQLKSANIAWAFDVTGVLTLSFTPALTGQKKNQLQAALDTRFGTGAVRIA